ncbi:MAG: hypothetical protein CBC01_07465 [Betaproteobacteria bacterium TMED41]|nr:MAG: hypothetical protein CBC01_07465 [Betaproteobacteria bacterium TMED41]
MFTRTRISFNEPTSNELLNEINTTPLVDVMLVLLIIFLITIPVVTSSVDVSLPRENYKLRNVNVSNLIITASKSGDFTIGTKTFELGLNNTFKDYIKQISILKPQPEVHIQADREIAFKNLGALLKLLQNSGIKRVAFLTDPSPDQ